MRRALASLLIAVFSFPLFAAGIFSESTPELPACCRRSGKHHCAMADTPTSGAPTIAANQSKCPLFPKANLAPVPSEAPAITVAGHSAAPPEFRLSLTSPAVYFRTELAGSALKRGPPVHA